MNITEQYKHIFEPELLEEFEQKAKHFSVKEGDIIAICNAGAYSYSMSSNYNARLRPAEVLISGGKDYLVRERESFDDLMRGQRLMKFS